MKGTYIIEHYNSSGEKAAPDYHGENNLRKEPFNTMFLWFFKNGREFSWNSSSSNYSFKFGDKAFRTEDLHGTVFQNYEESRDANKPVYTSNAFDAVFHRRFPLTDNKKEHKNFYQMILITNAGLNTIDTNHNGDVLNPPTSPAVVFGIGNKCSVYSYTKDQLRTFINGRHPGIPASEFEATYNNIQKEYSGSLLFVTDNDTLRTIGTQIKIPKPGKSDNHYKIQYDITLTTTFKNTLTTPLPIAKLSVMAGPPVEYLHGWSTVPHSIPNTYFRSKVSNNSLFATYADFNRLLQPDEEIVVKYTLHFEFYYPIAGVPFRFKTGIDSTPEELRQTVSGRLYFIRNNDDDIPEENKNTFSDTDLLMNGQGGPAMHSLVPRYVGTIRDYKSGKIVEYEALETACLYGANYNKIFDLSDFKQNKFVVKNNNTNKMMFKTEKGELISHVLQPYINIGGNDTYFQNKSNNAPLQIKIEPPLFPFYFINTISNSNTTRTWYNWLLTFDNPVYHSAFNPNYDGTAITESMHFHLPVTALLHNWPDTAELDSLERSI